MNDVNVEVNDSDGIVIKINPYELWQMLPAADKEMVIGDSAHWGIVEEALKHDVGRSLSTPHFNNSIHKFREMVLTDSEFVNEMAVSFVKQLLQMLATQMLKESEASGAYWRLYHAVGHHDRPLGIQHVEPVNINRDDVLKKVMELLGDAKGEAVVEEVMSDEQFNALIQLLMVSDPFPLGDEAHDVLSGFANNEARKRGCHDWVDAYHTPFWNRDMVDGK